MKKLLLPSCGAGIITDGSERCGKHANYEKHIDIPPGSKVVIVGGRKNAHYEAIKAALANKDITLIDEDLSDLPPRGMLQSAYAHQFDQSIPYYRNRILPPIEPTISAKRGTNFTPKKKKRK